MATLKSLDPKTEKEVKDAVVKAIADDLDFTFIKWFSRGYAKHCALCDLPTDTKPLKDFGGPVYVCRRCRKKNESLANEAKKPPLRVGWYDLGGRDYPFTSFNTDGTWKKKDHEALEKLYKRYPSLQWAFEDAIDKCQKGRVMAILRRHFPRIVFYEVPEDRR